MLTDIDDTLTTHGRLTAEAYAAVERLADAGLAVIPVTGRPAGWCDHIARMWPVAAVVGENGAFYFRYDAARRTLIRRFARDDAARTDDRAALAELRAEILDAVPGAAVASDQRYRESDLAIDYCEDVGPLPAADVERIVAMARAKGASVKVSSIHVNIWFGDHDKLSTTDLLMREIFELDLARDQSVCLFVGDSPNDEPMFRAFRNAVAVANVERFLPAMTDRPRFVTTRPAGAGFAELAERLLAGHGETPAADVGRGGDQ